MATQGPKGGENTVNMVDGKIVGLARAHVFNQMSRHIFPDAPTSSEPAHVWAKLKQKLNKLLELGSTICHPNGLGVAACGQFLDIFFSTNQLTKLKN